MRLKNILLPILTLVVLAACGCNDPYSQRRIDRRVANQREFINDIRKSEHFRAIRLHEAGLTVERWHRNRVERWNRIAPTVGDYIY